MNRRHNAKRFFFFYDAEFNADDLFELIKDECKNLMKEVKLCVIARVLDKTFVYLEIDKKIHTTNRYFMSFPYKDKFYIPISLKAMQTKTNIIEYLVTRGDVIFEYGMDVNKYLEARKKHKKFIL